LSGRRSSRASKSDRRCGAWLAAAGGGSACRPRRWRCQARRRHRRGSGSARDRVVGADRPRLDRTHTCPACPFCLVCQLCGGKVFSRGTCNNSRSPGAKTRGQRLRNA
jgi:hypothetical protein